MNEEVLGINGRLNKYFTWFNFTYRHGDFLKYTFTVIASGKGVGSVSLIYDATAGVTYK